VGKNNPSGNLENITVRLDSKLRVAAEKSAEAHGRNLAVEIRTALTNYYKLGTGTVTFEALEERLRKHEELFHGAKIDLWPDQYRMAVQDSGVPAEVNKIEEVVPKIEPESDKATLSTEKIADTVKILTHLIRMLEAGTNSTSSDLKEATGISSRKIGRLLNAQGIVAKNTRIAKRAARYYLPAMLPQVKEVYKGLNQ
jgi:hypothetical protein